MREPQRTCIGCGARRDKSALLRLVLVQGQVVLDAAAHLPGRGAYLCGPACGEKALSRRALDRAFRRAVPGGAEAVRSGWKQGSASRPRGGDRG